MADTIPLVSPTNKRLGTVPRSVAATMPESQLVRSRKGVIVLVLLKPLTCHVRPVLRQQAGQTESIVVAGMPVFAMRGINGRLI